MSVRATAVVWEQSQHKGSALLLLLAIADYAHDDGSNAFPSLPTLANKIRMSERNVRYLLRDLVASGEVVLEGATKAGTHMMRVVLPGLTPLPRAYPERLCPICEARPGVNYHHKIPKGAGGKGKRNNLIALCDVCHRLMHFPGKADLTPAGLALAEGATLEEVRRLMDGANIAPRQTLPPGKPASPGGQNGATGGQRVAPDPLLNHQQPSEDVKPSQQQETSAERLARMRRALRPTGIGRR